jgi:hypothetical protein
VDAGADPGEDAIEKSTSLDTLLSFSDVISCDCCELVSTPFWLEFSPVVAVA